jgi:hypothetical protein
MVSGGQLVVHETKVQLLLCSEKHTLISTENEAKVMATRRVRIVYIVGHDESARRDFIQRMNENGLDPESGISPQQLLEAIVAAAGGCAVLGPARSKEMEKILQERLDERKISGSIVAIKVCEKAAKKNGK